MQDLIRKDRQCGHGPAHTTHSRLFEISSFKSNSIYAFYWVFYSIFWNRDLRYQTYGYHFDMNQLYQCSVCIDIIFLLRLQNSVVPFTIYLFTFYAEIRDLSQVSVNLFFCLKHTSPVTILVLIVSMNILEEIQDYQIHPLQNYHFPLLNVVVMLKYYSPLKFSRKILRIGVFEKLSFFESVILNFFFKHF